MVGGFFNSCLTNGDIFFTGCGRLFSVHVCTPWRQCNARWYSVPCRRCRSFVCAGVQQSLHEPVLCVPLRNCRGELLTDLISAGQGFKQGRGDACGGAFFICIALPREGPLICRVCDVYSEEELRFLCALKRN